MKTESSTVPDEDQGFSKETVFKNLYEHVEYLSDNSSFWHYGYRAIMVTDTSFYRNRHYHQEKDAIDTLNFNAMSEVVKGLFYTTMEL